MVNIITYISQIKFKTILLFNLFILIVISTLLLTCEKINFERIMAISTDEVSGITSSSASIKFSLIDLGEGMNDYGVFYSTSPNAHKGNKLSLGQPKAIGEITATIDSLLPGTQYFIKAYGAINDKFAYGDELDFTTLISIPAVQTIGSSDISYTTAIITGEILSNGGADIITKGFCWSNEQSPTLENSNIEVDTGETAFAATLNKLQKNTTYFYRAYATNIAGTAYGETLNLTTGISLPTISAIAISNTKAKTASCGGEVIADGGDSISARGICLSTSPNPSIKDNKTIDGKGTGSFTSNITELLPSTTYYVRAYATNSKGTSYTNEFSFTTQSGIPEITTNEADTITSRSASVGGVIISDGGLDIVSYGVVYDTVSGSKNAAAEEKLAVAVAVAVAVEFSIKLEDLDINTIYYVRAYVTNEDSTFYGVEKNFTTLNGQPVVTTNEISDTTAVSATCGGNVIDDGFYEITARGICWNTTGNPTINDSLTNNGTGLGSYTNSLSDLAINTTYYVKAYSTNEKGTSYGEEKVFTTLDGLAILTTNTITDITAISAACSGTISSDGGYPILERGLCWNTTGVPTLSDTKTSNGSGTGSFVGNLTSLSINTKYYIKAYATNGNGTQYGEEKEFTTLEGLPFISTITASNITYNSATSGGNITNDGSFNITEKGVCWNTTGLPTIMDNKTSDGTGTGSFSSDLTALNLNSTYYLRAYATNLNGTTYGKELNINTLDGLPTLTTTNVSENTGTLAISGGNITNEGASSIIERGICWNTSGSPTINDFKTSDGAENGEYTSSLAGLTLNTIYYVRAYATNSDGTSYGNEISFLAEENSGTFLDSRDNIFYKWVKIGDQVWMAENLRATKYIDGTNIPLVSDSIEWENLRSNITDDAYCWYENNSNYANTYGALYTWAAAMGDKAVIQAFGNPSGFQGICPDNWHLPSDYEWQELKDFISSDGYNNNEGTALKTIDGWDDNGNGINYYGFSSLPGGKRINKNGQFINKGKTCTWWTTDEAAGLINARTLDVTEYNLYLNFPYPNEGNYVRCVKDTITF